MNAKKFRLISHFAVVALVLLALTACDLFAKEKAEKAEKARIECLDKICYGDVAPKVDNTKDVILKLNGQWYVGPKEYFSSSGAGGFEWWQHKPISSAMKRPVEMQALAVEGKGYDFAVEIFLRSDNIPMEPLGFNLIKLAQEKGWIEERKTLRPGLDAIKMKHVIGPKGYYIDHVTYYVATQIKGVDGLPPVATCAHVYPNDSGGTGFMWQPGIWAGTRMNQRHCADWPEIFQEITRVLQLLKKV